MHGCRLQKAMFRVPCFIQDAIRLLCFIPSCLPALTEAIETQQRWALCWMGAPQRYQAAIEQLKAQLIDEILNDPVRSKQLDSLERKLLNYLSLFEQCRVKARAPTALEAG